MDIFRVSDREEGLSPEEIRSALLEALAGRSLKKVLILPPDFTRFHSNAGYITNVCYHELTDRGVHVDIMPALGTHAPMTIEQIQAMYGDIPPELFLVHDWRHNVVRLGEVPGDYIAAITDGLWTDPVSVEVNRRIMDESYDLILSPGQVVPHGRLPAGELDIEGAAVRHQVIVLLFDLFETEIRFRRFPRGGKAHRAAQVAAPCQLQQHAAAFAQMPGAEAAVVRAALFRRPPLARRIDGGVFAVPAEIRGQIALPDQSGKSAVLVTALVEIDAVLFRTLLRIHDAQADRADAFGFSDDHSSPRSDRISMHFS